MSMVKRVSMFILLGAVLGDAVGTLVARSFIPWYWSPGEAINNTQQLINVPDMVRSTIDAMVRYQMIGASVGAVAFAVLGFLLFRTLDKRKAGTTPAT
jgi:hypothetical protein